MLQNAYFLAKIGADTVENEQHFAEILPKTGNYPGSEPLLTPGVTGARGARHRRRPAPSPPRAPGRGPRPGRVRPAFLGLLM